MKDYEIECPECRGDCQCHYIVDGNDSEIDTCETCKGAGQLTINPVEYFDDQIQSMDSAFNKIVKDMKEHGLTNCEIKSFIDTVVSNYKNEI